MGQGMTFSPLVGCILGVFSPLREKDVPLETVAGAFKAKKKEKTKQTKKKQQETDNGGRMILGDFVAQT